MKTVADAMGHISSALRYNTALNDTIALLEDDGPRPGPLQMDALLGRAKALLGSVPPTNASDLMPWITLLRDCDLWYSPICTGIWTEVDGYNLEAADRQLRRLGRLNSEDELEIVITRHAVASIWGSGEYIVRGRDWPNSFLHFITFIPATLRAHGPDFGSDRTSAERSLKIQFLRAETPAPRPLVGDRVIRLGIAPLLTDQKDIRVALQNSRDGRSWYHIEPLVPDSVIEKAIRDLADAGAEIIVIPECAVDSRQLPLIKKTLRSLSNSKPVPLSIIGVSTIPDCDDGYALNQAVILDRYGSELARNDKLIRWNLSDRERRDLGFDEPQASDRTFLYENIRPGETVTIVEIADLGRLTTLICADLIALHPSDWIRKHLCLDWTFTPLFDSAIEAKRWMGREAERAALESSGRVVVANSTVLQSLYKRGKPKAPASCGVLFTVDGRLGKTTAAVTRIACSEPSGAILLYDWPS